MASTHFAHREHEGDDADPDDVPLESSDDSVLSQADRIEREQYKRLERDEHKEKEEDDAQRAADPHLLPLFSLSSSHLQHNLHTALHSSTFDQLQSLFQLDDSSHPECSCYWCSASSHHREARRRRRQRGWVSMVAPMVRYSKLPFRLLCRQYGADIAFTPMIIAAGFTRSALARESEFSSNAQDQPLIVQFGTDSAAELVQAVQLCLPYVQGVDINCGCPQRWAMQSGYGAALLSQPQLVSEMVRAVRAVTSAPLSIKIRLQPELRLTVELLHRAEHAGLSFITVHGRTPQQRRQPVNAEAIALVKSAASIPVIANGDVHSLAALSALQRVTRVDGFMSARGVLSNPALFSSQSMPLSVLPAYLRLAEQYGGRYSLHHHHLQFMLAGRLSRAERMQFGSLRSLAAVRDFMQERGWMEGEQAEEMQAHRDSTAAAAEDEDGTAKESADYGEDNEQAQRSRPDDRR